MVDVLVLAHDDDSAEPTIVSELRAIPADDERYCPVPPTPPPRMSAAEFVAAEADAARGEALLRRAREWRRSSRVAARAERPPVTLVRLPRAQAQGRRPRPSTSPRSEQPARPQTASYRVPTARARDRARRARPRARCARRRSPRAAHASRSRRARPRRARSCSSAAGPTRGELATWRATRRAIALAAIDERAFTPRAARKRGGDHGGGGAPARDGARRGRPARARGARRAARASAASAAAYLELGDSSKAERERARVGALAAMPDAATPRARARLRGSSSWTLLVGVCQRWRETHVAALPALWSEISSRALGISDPKVPPAIERMVFLAGRGVVSLDLSPRRATRAGARARSS